MYHSTRQLILCVVSVVLTSTLTLAACGPSPEELASQTATAQTAIAAAWTDTPTSTATATSTSTATAMPTSTATTTPTSVATATPTLMATPEVVDASFFCSDSRVLKQIRILQNAVRNHDGQQFANLVSPNGLYMRLWPAYRAIHLTIDEVRGFFDDDTIRYWGTSPWGDWAVLQSLAGGVTALLEEDLLPQNVKIACNDNQAFSAEPTVLYFISVPDYFTASTSYTVSNFYSVMRPGAPGWELEWGAWGLGFEYWQGRPTLIVLTHYVWEA